MNHIVQLRHMKTDELIKKINTLNPWYYPVTIDGVLVMPGIGSTGHTPAMRLSQRTLYRKHLIVDEVAMRHVEITNAKILDVACNMGYWSWQYVLRGAQQVTGIEGRKLFVDQAKLFWAHCKPAPTGGFKFVHGSVLDPVCWQQLGQSAPYDICLCCGLLYHLEDYRAFLELLSRTARARTIVIDTRVAEGREKPHDEPSGIYFNSLDDAPKRAVTPSFAGLISHMRQLGYDTSTLHPRFLMPESTKSVDDYISGNRVTLLCTK